MAAVNENAATMADAAGRNALDAAGLKPSDIDMIIVTSTTPHMVFPKYSLFSARKIWYSQVVLHLI